MKCNMVLGVTYVSVSHFTHEDGHDKSRDGGRRVCQGHQGAGIVGGNIDMIGKESAIHSGDEHGAECHESHSRLAIASGEADSNEAQSR